jgi:hypothetical protein
MEEHPPKMSGHYPEEPPFVLGNWLIVLLGVVVLAYACFFG